MCNGSYKNKRALQRHIRYAHSGKDNNPSPVKDIPSPPHQATATPGTIPSPQPAPPAPLTPHQNGPVSPPITNQPGQWPDQFRSVPMAMANSQMEMARQQLQYMQRMQMIREVTLSRDRDGSPGCTSDHHSSQRLSVVLFVIAGAYSLPELVSCHCFCVQSLSVLNISFIYQ